MTDRLVLAGAAPKPQEAIRREGKFLIVEGGMFDPCEVVAVVAAPAPMIGGAIMTFRSGASLGVAKPSAKEIQDAIVAACRVRDELAALDDKHKHDAEISAAGKIPAGCEC